MPVLSQITSNSGTLSIKPLSAQITQNPSNSSLNIYLIFDTGSNKAQTSVSHFTQGNPAWNEEIQLDVSHHQSVMIEVWDKSNSNDVIGVSQIQVPKVIAMGGKDQDFFPIFYQQKLVGTLQLACTYKGTSSNIKENYPPINTSQTSQIPSKYSEPQNQNTSYNTQNQIKQQLYTQEPLKTTPSPMNAQVNYAPQMAMNQPMTQQTPIQQQVPVTQQQPVMMQPQYQYQQAVPNTVVYNVPQPQTQIVYTQPPVNVVNAWNPYSCYNPYVGPMFGAYGYHYGHHGHHHHC